MKSAATLALAALLCATGFVQDRDRAPSGRTADPRTPPLALTPTEYNNTIADLLGFPRDGDRWPPRPPLADTLSPRRAAGKGVFLPPPPPPVWPWRFPSEPGAGGFEGIVQGQNPSSYQVEELHLAAMHFAAFAPLSPPFYGDGTFTALMTDHRGFLSDATVDWSAPAAPWSRSAWALDCADWTALASAAQEHCARASIERFAERAWRRPLAGDERERLAAFWQANLTAGPIDEAIALTVAASCRRPRSIFVSSGAMPRAANRRRGSSRPVSPAFSGIRCPTRSCSRRPGPAS